MVKAKKNKVIDKNTINKRKWETFFRFIFLLGGLFWLVVYVKVMQTGFLSCIGIVVATFFALLIVLSFILGLVWKKCFERVLNRIFGGIFIVILLILGIVLIWPEGNHTWKQYRFDTELADIEAGRAVPENENAAFRYESLFAKIDIDIEDPPIFFGELREKPWKSIDYPEASMWIDAHTGIIDELLQIGTMEKCRWPFNVEVCIEYTVSYKSLRYCAQLLTIAGNRDLGEGQYQKAMEKYFCLLRMAEHLYQQTLSLDFKGGFYPEYEALQMIRYILVQSDLMEEDINLITGHLPTTANNWQRDISKLLEFEKFRFANIMSVAYEINEKGRIRFSKSSGTLFLNKRMWEHPKRTDRLRRLYRLMNMPLDPNGLWDMAEVEAAKFSLFLEQDPMPDIDTVTVEWLFCGFTNMLSNTPRWAAKNICFNKILYAMFKGGYTSHITMRRGTWLVLGLRKYRNEHGSWPESLEQVSDYVPPEAFIDLTNGDKFVYVREGDGFRLYSKGQNNIDEGGRNNDGADDWPIWPPQSYSNKTVQP